VTGEEPTADRPGSEGGQPGATGGQT
jgi:hypothetical protein